MHAYTTTPPTKARQKTLLNAGAKLCPNELEELEVLLDACSQDVEARIKALGFYFDRLVHGTEMRENFEQRYQSHLIALIHQTPGISFFRDPYLIKDLPALELIRNEWLMIVDGNLSNTGIVRNTLQFFDMCGKFPDDHEKLLLQLNESADWIRELLDFYCHQLKITDGQRREKYATKALETIVAFIGGMSQEDAFPWLPLYAEVLLENGQLEESERIAKIVLQFTEDAKAKQVQLKNLGDLVHKANQILGRIQCRRNDIESAKVYLMASCNVPESPSLSSFGPELSLVNELLAVGEIDAVLIFFESLKKSWISGEVVLEYWIKQLSSKPPYILTNRLEIKSWSE